MNSYGFPLILSWPRWPLQVLVSALVTAIFDRLSPVAAALDADVSLRSTGPRTFSPKRRSSGAKGATWHKFCGKLVIFDGILWDLMLIFWDFMEMSWTFMVKSYDFMGFHQI